MEVLQPLAIGDVGLAARHVLDMTGVDQAHPEAAVFQDLKERNPENARGLHRHAFDAALLEPIGQLLEFLGEGTEVRTGCGSRSVGTATRSPLPRYRLRPCWAPALGLRATREAGEKVFVWTWFLLAGSRRPECVRRNNLLNGIGLPTEAGRHQWCKHQTRNHADLRARLNKHH